jgi:acyl-CoA synthetase (AMP-forming)/AMP-acid ligase II
VLLLCAYADRDAMSLTSDDCGLIVMPMHHVSALRAELLAYLVAGGSAMCAESPVSDDSIIAGLRDPRVTTLTASPFYYQAVVNRLASTGERLECPSLRFLRSSSSGLSAGLHARLEAAIGVPVIEDYGATEAGLVAMNPLPPGTRKPGSVGRPVSVELRVMSDYWEPLPPGQTGELVVRGGTVFAGYDSPADTSAKFKDGWLRMGDRGYLDNDGYLWLAGRTDDIINRGGEKIDPSEVEAVLLAYDGVADAVAFGLPDAAYGHEVYAAVVVRPGARVNASELRAAARQTLHRRAPRMITIVGSLPKTSTGKVKRREAAAMYADSVRTPE